MALPSPRGDAQARCQDVFGIAARDACLRGDNMTGKPAFTRGKRNADSKGSADAGPDLPGADAVADTGQPDLAFWSAGTLDFGAAQPCVA